MFHRVRHRLVQLPFRRVTQQVVHQRYHHHSQRRLQAASLLLNLAPPQHLNLVVLLRLSQLDSLLVTPVRYHPANLQQFHLRYRVLFLLANRPECPAESRQELHQDNRRHYLVASRV